jgi:putative Mg2+ transporter-C (MgtC) family protein
VDILLADLQPQLQLVGRVALAMVLGAAIGLERELSVKPAGLRTHMLVAGAAALFVGLADTLALKFFEEAYADTLRVEPIRIVGAIITGISFLGAGTIFRDQRGSIEGLTTAASILVVSGIGIAVALDQFVLAVCVTILVLHVLVVARALERFLERSRG